MADSPWTDSVTHQQDATAWVWNQIWDGRKALSMDDPVSDPAWSEFDVVMSDSSVITVRVELKGK